MQKLIITLGLACAFIYVAMSLINNPVDEQSTVEEVLPDRSSTYTAENTSLSFEHSQQLKSTQQAVVSLDASSETVENTKIEQGLPASISLLGIFYTGEWQSALAELVVNDTQGIYRETEQLEQTDIYVKSISRTSITLEYESVDYVLTLGASNSLASKQQQYDYRRMTADEIGARPKLLEHIVQMGDDVYADGGRDVFAGINPKLFRAARFKEGDILLAVNGFDISSEEALAELQGTIPNSKILRFTVNRNGRTITLYYDIPDPGLIVE